MRAVESCNVAALAAGTVMKLGDLGLGRYFSSETEVTHSTVGTPYYMSPECIQGLPYDFKSDIWSLGCLLYEVNIAAIAQWRFAPRYLTPPIRDLSSRRLGALSTQTG